MRGLRTPIDLSTPRRAIDVVGTALTLYRSYPGLFLALAFIVVAPYALIVLAVTGTSPLGQTGTSATLLLLLLDVGVVVPLVSALHVRAVAAVARGERPGIGAVLGPGVGALAVVVAAQLMADLGVFVGFLCFVVPGVILALRWAVVAQVAAVERTDWMGALRRAGELSAGNYLHVFGVMAITFVINIGITRAGLALAGSKVTVWQVVLGIALNTLTRSFTALTTAVLYFELRGRRGERASAVV